MANEIKPFFRGDLSFIKKASGKVSALAFMRQHAGYIRVQYPSAIPLLDDGLSGVQLPTPSLQAICKVAMDHYLAEGLKKAEKSLQREKEKTLKGTGSYLVQFYVLKVDERTEKRETVLFVDEDGAHTFACDSYMNAQNYVDRKQNENCVALYATIRNTSGPKVILTNIPRADSIVRRNPKIKSAVCQPKASGESKPFKNYCTGKQTRASFSAG